LGGASVSLLNSLVSSCAVLFISFISSFKSSLISFRCLLTSSLSSFSCFLPFRLLIHIHFDLFCWLVFICSL
jgi:hypothetical protein